MTNLEQGKFKGTPVALRELPPREKQSDSPHLTLLTK